MKTEQELRKELKFLREQKLELFKRKEFDGELQTLGRIQWICWVLGEEE